MSPYLLELALRSGAAYPGRQPEEGVVLAQHGQAALYALALSCPVQDVLEGVPGLSLGLHIGYLSLLQPQPGHGPTPMQAAARRISATVPQSSTTLLLCALVLNC